MQKTVKKAQKGFTLIELLIVIAVIAILAAIAIPNLLSSRKAANESSAISAVRTLISAQETYRSRYQTYCNDIGAMGQPATAGAYSSTEAGLVDDVLAGGTKSGYTLAVTGTTTGYTVTAVPVTFGTTGERHFKADQSGVIMSSSDKGTTWLALD